MTPHPITTDLIPALHRLNQDNAVELSSLTLAEFEALIAKATHTRAIGSAGFMLTFDQTADYDSPNFLWFRERYERFIYVDRIAIAASHRGEGLARSLYEDLFVWASEAGCPRIVAEFNTDPPNPGSEAFHAKLGFEAVGEAVLGQGKAVRYISRAL